MTVTDEHARLIDEHGQLASDYGALLRKFNQLSEQMAEIQQRTRQPLICKVLGHRWKITHMLKRAHYSDTSDSWIYYAHTCTRCWYEEKRSFWPSL